MRKNFKLNSDVSDSGRKKCKGGCGGAYGGIRRRAFRGSLQSGDQFCVDVFGSALASVKLKMFSHSIYFVVSSPHPGGVNHDIWRAQRVQRIRCWSNFGQCYEHSRCWMKELGTSVTPWQNYEHYKYWDAGSSVNSLELIVKWKWRSWIVKCSVRLCRLSGCTTDRRQKTERILGRRNETKRELQVERQVISDFINENTKRLHSW